jgi:triphosphoribosyl-dephospho-CoA synthase
VCAVNAHRDGVLRALVMSAVRDACRLDVEAFKPGNVSVLREGHGMAAEHFMLSAELIAAPLTLPGASVGERIRAAVEATRARLAFNTNLGIVLMLAPLVHAALEGRTGAALRGEVGRVLDALTVADAVDAYTAIRLAQPGGLGTSARHDVSEAPTVTLLEAMREAAGRDLVARQYANGYADVFGVAMPRLREARGAWESEPWAMVAAYLRLLALAPDSHIVRKHGEAAALTVTREARLYDSLLQELDRPEELLPKLRDWDERLKARGLNPGATADLTVAALLALALEALGDGSTAAGPSADDRVAIRPGSA